MSEPPHLSGASNDDSGTERQDRPVASSNDDEKSEWSVLEAEPDQLGAVHSLLCDCVPQAGTYAMIYLEWLRSAPQCRLFVVVHESNVVACALLLAQADNSLRRFGHVQALCVAESVRRRGVASSLLRAAENWFLSFDAEYSALHVPKKSKAARALYAKHGYNCDSLKKNYYENKDAAFLMKKPL